MYEKELFKLNPNTSKSHVIYITEVPYRDNSGTEFLIDYQEMNCGPEYEQYNTPIYRVGICDLISGKLRFDGCNIPEGLVPGGISIEALSRLSQWMLDNRSKFREGIELD